MEKFEITGPGDFVTRDGRRVTIHSIEGKGSWPASGAIWRMFRGKLRPKGYRIWALSGQNDDFKQKPTDIVGRWVETAPAAD